MPAPQPHLVQFYERDEFLFDSVARFVGTGIGAGDAVVVVASVSHIVELCERLAKRGVDVRAQELAGRFIALDAEATLAEFVVDGRVDAERFREVAGGVIARAAGPENLPVRAYGEMVSLLWADGRRVAAIELERLWNELASSLPFALLCSYPIAAFEGELDEAAFHAVCAEHSDIIPAESYAALGSEVERSRAIAQLQHKARLLEREVAYRKEVQEALRDVATENARLLDAERIARSEAEAANRSKEEFLAMLAHELRNPLSAVRNAVLSARFDARRREQAMEIATRGVDHLTHLVDDLLDVARISQGRITLRKQLVSIRRVVESAVESTRNLIEARAHALTLSLPGSDVQIDADATRLEQILVNLVSNAAKYTDPHGQIQVSASHAGSEATFRVHDNGMGIAPEMLPRIFDLFAQSDRALDRSQGGLGIGLTVVKRLAVLHGGSVRVSSEGPGCGAEFEVRLPGVVARRPLDAADPTGETARHSVRVLVVEDNRDVAESLAMLLESLGHRPVVAHDGSRALEAAARERFDVILMDIGLPGMDGYQIALRMRRELGLRGMLVALTGYGCDGDRQRALASGFDLHLVKPLDPSALKRLLAEVGSLGT